MPRTASKLEKINLGEKYRLFKEWNRVSETVRLGYKVVGEFNDNLIKLSKMKGEFVWHQHDGTDELFLVVKGRLTIKLRDGEVILKEGELFVVPKGVEHKTVAPREVHTLLIEARGTVNTGNVRSDLTVEKIEKMRLA